MSIEERACGCLAHVLQNRQPRQARKYEAFKIFQGMHLICFFAFKLERLAGDSLTCLIKIYQASKSDKLIFLVNDRLTPVFLCAYAFACCARWAAFIVWGRLVCPPLCAVCQAGRA